MKMMYGGVPIKTVKVKHFEVDTNFCDMEPSDLQAGKTGVAKGRMITGTGKCFEFASYGGMETNIPDYVPTLINTIEIASTVYPIKTVYALNDIKNVDFSTEQIIGFVIIDGIEYPITAKVQNYLLTLSCEKSITLQTFYGRDKYV